MPVESFDLVSSNVERAEFNPDTGELRVWFHNGGPYVRENVDPETVKAFRSSVSPGRFWRDNLEELG